MGQLQFTFMIELHVWCQLSVKQKLRKCLGFSMTHNAQGWRGVLNFMLV